MAGKAAAAAAMASDIRLKRDIVKVGERPDGIDGTETRLEREVANSQRPICVHCTRAARTCDMPSVVVRADRCRLLRDAEQRYWLLSECHGAREALEVKLEGIEELVERVEVFRDD